MARSTAVFCLACAGQLLAAQVLQFGVVPGAASAIDAARIPVPGCHNVLAAYGYQTPTDGFRSREFGYGYGYAMFGYGERDPSGPRGAPRGRQPLEVELRRFVVADHALPWRLPSPACATLLTSVDARPLPQS